VRPQDHVTQPTGTVTRNLTGHAGSANRRQSFEGTSNKCVPVVLLGEMFYREGGMGCETYSRAGFNGTIRCFLVEDSLLENRQVFALPSTGANGIVELST
jgi:hypothetical protein